MTNTYTLILNVSESNLNILLEYKSLLDRQETFDVTSDEFSKISKQLDSIELRFASRFLAALGYAAVNQFIGAYNKQLQLAIEDH